MKIIRWLRAFRRAKVLEKDKWLLLDRVRQIEWRLAMCRSCAVDVNVAHAVATETLMMFDAEPYATSASRYNISQQEKLLAEARGERRALSRRSHIQPVKSIKS